MIGVMILGMALYKMGIFSAEKSAKFYSIMALVGYGIGLPMAIYGSQQLVASNFDVIQKFVSDGNFDYIGGLFIAFGHIALIMLLCKSNILNWLKKSLSSVGRMAFSNYIMHTVVMTTIFYGYGLSLYGEFQRYQLYYFVVGMWIIQMILSPIWLKRFNYGPLEWVWRTLTYGKTQPLRRAINSD